MIDSIPNTFSSSCETQDRLGLSAQKADQSSPYRFSIEYGSIFFALCLFNILFVDSMLCIVLAAVEIIFVFSFILKKEIDHAVLWHFLFIITSISPTTAMLEDVSIRNYGCLKLLGPVSWNYTISIILFFYSLNQRNVFKNTLLSQFSNYLLLIGAIGLLFAIYGFLFRSYLFHEATQYLIYWGMAYCNLFIALRNVTPYIKEKMPFYFYNLLIASPIATFVSWFIFHKVTNYAGLPALIQCDVDFLAPILLFFLLNKDISKIILLISLSCLLLNLRFSGGGGEFLIFLISCIMIVILLFSTNYRSIISTAGKICFPLFFLATGVYFVQFAMQDNFYSSVSSIKIRQLMSLFSVFQVKDIHSIQDFMGSSPYVRLSETIDAVYENYSHSILNLLFGSGYGGYITDELGLLREIALDHGSYSYERVLQGTYGRVHGTIPSVTLIHGLFGITGFFYFILKYIKKIKYCPFAFCAIIWLGMSFYFNLFSATYGIIALLSCDILCSHSVPDQQDSNTQQGT